MRLKLYFYTMPGKPLSKIRALSAVQAREAIKFHHGIKELPRGTKVWAVKRMQPRAMNGVG